jgi:hypothetical protein
VNPPTRFRHLGVHARCFVLLVATGLIAGCTGGPKLSLTSPSTWPGASQVAGAGNKVGGWVSEKAQSRRARKQAKAAAVARRESSRATTNDETNSKLRAIFTQGNDRGANQPADPFLAQTAQANQKVASASHSNNNTKNDRLPNDRREANLKSAAHSVDGPKVPAPKQSAPIDPNVNPFADLANSRNIPPTKIREKSSVDNPFAGGIDTQLAQLREQAGRSETPATRNELPIERNPLRDAILGDAVLEDSVLEDSAVIEDSADEPQAGQTTLPNDAIVPIIEDVVPPVDKIEVPVVNIDEPADIEEPPVGRAVGRAVVRSGDFADELLPEWAREPSPQPEQRETLPSKETQSFANQQIDPANETPFIPSEESPAADRIHVARNAIETPLTEIEIDPSPVIISPRFRSGNPIDNAEAAGRVEFVSPPPADVIAPPVDVVAIEEHGSLPESDDAFGEMIVESDSLPSGFAEWHGNDGGYATLRTNTPLNAQEVSSSSNAGVPARLAVNSRPVATAPVPAATDAESSDQNPFVVRPHLLREIPSSGTAIDDVKDANEQAEPLSDPFVFPQSNTDGDQALESSLDSISWDPETEPGAAAAGNSLFESTAMIGLLIGVVCLIGLALIRRMYTTA